MQSHVKRVSFGNLTFNLSENVYEPAEDTYLFAENINVNEGDFVLDMGTGSGLLAVLASQKAGSVVSVDINPCAVRCAKENAVLNHAKSKIDFIQADLFTALSETAKFDLILFNAPYLPSEEKDLDDWLSHAWTGGENGRQVIDRFIAKSLPHLKNGGRILLLQSSLTGVEETVRKFEAHHFEVRVKAQLNLPFFESLFLIEAKVKEQPKH